MLSLAAPWWLLLTPLPWLLRPVRPGTSSASAPRLPLALWTAHLAASRSGFTPRRWLSLVLLSLTWLCLVTALARPQLVDERVSLPESGRDLMLVVDLSPSMETRDMLVGNRGITRLEAIKRLGAEFIQQRKGDRLGLVVFSTTAHLYAPLTFDHRTVQDFLRESFIGMAGEATSIGDALGLAVKNLRQQDAEDRGLDTQKRRERVILLLTDGDSNAGRITPEMATELAVEAGIRVHTLGIGSTDPQNNRRGLRRSPDRGGVDQALLRNLAGQTGGRFFMAENMPGLESVYSQIDALEPIKQEPRPYRFSRDLYHWPLTFGLMAFLLARLTREGLSMVPSPGHRARPATTEHDQARGDKVQ